MSEGKIHITDSFYLKLFQQNMDAPYVIKELAKFDCLLVDEGQDLNPIQAFFLQNCAIPQKLIVGDRHQSIYAWRKAVNTLSQLQWPQLNLTTSFRFKNQTVVDIANHFLRNWKCDENQIVAKPTNKQTNTTAYISRTNAKLVERIASLTEPFQLVREPDAVFSELFVAEKILKYIRTKDKTYRDDIPAFLTDLIDFVFEYEDASQNRLELLMKELQEMNDLDMIVALSIAKRHDIYYLYEKTQRLNSKDARVFLTTAHTSKGLEFSRVVLDDDFPSAPDLIAEYVYSHLPHSEKQYTDEELQKKITETLTAIVNDDVKVSSLLDELNLQYVAVTRAIDQIAGYRDIEHFFEIPAQSWIPYILQAIKALSSTTNQESSTTNQEGGENGKREE